MEKKKRSASPNSVKGKKSLKDKPLDGEIKEFYPNGKIAFEYTVKDGKFNGPYKEYFENGKVMMEGTSVNGEWDGSLKFYDENGNLKVEMKYDKGNLLEEIRLP